MRSEHCQCRLPAPWRLLSVVEHSLSLAPRARTQAYRHWKKSSHEYFFISNNDVLVPNGALTSLMRVMREDGGEFRHLQCLRACIHAIAPATFKSLRCAEGSAVPSDHGLHHPDVGAH